ncbi:MAG: glycosyltransferase family 2 protein [Thermoleophilaceae bacterium]
MAPAAGTDAPPPVTVAVVSWNTRELLAQCLRSLHPEVVAGRASVWVVDNASSDGSAAMVREQAPWATLVEPGENLGFGAAVDLVAARTDSPWLAPANADIALAPGALATLLEAGAHPRTGVVAPRLVLPEGCTQHSVHPFPTLAFTIAFNLGLATAGRRCGDRLCLEGHWNPERARTVAWAIGAFLLIRRSAFEAAGGFDAQQWMYAEDLDIGWRLADLGYLTRYEPAAVVFHDESAAADPAFGPDKVARFTAATYAVIARRRGRARAWLTGLANCLGAAARVALLTPSAGRRPGRRAARDGVRLWLRAQRGGLRMLARRGA